MTSQPISQPIDCPVTIEDDRTGTSVETLKRALADNFYYLQGKDETFATLTDYYMALAYTVRDRLVHRRIKTAKTCHDKEVKFVYYLSAEFLIGRLLINNMINLGIYDQMKTALQESGLNLDDLMEREEEPGLGNGGLGRLAACFLDSMAALELPAMGYGIRYEFGIFDQLIADGWQTERPDNWLQFGNPWELHRPEYTADVNFGGHTETYTDEKGKLRVRWVPQIKVIGMPYDTPIPGYGNNTVNTLRLWSAKAGEDFDLNTFNAGDYIQAVAAKTFSENISKVLYPNDNTPQGKELRLQQQYFFVACSLQDIIRLHLRKYKSFDNFAEKTAIQLNDTHPTIGVAELMRLLLDEHGLEWSQAWEITRHTFAFTNHTLLSEALERWSVSLFGRLLPRHLEIIYEINRQFMDEVRLKYPNDAGKMTRMSLIEEGEEKKIRMAHLACVGSFAINGVAALHTELVKKDLFRDFYELWPEKFQNKTNGITPRRWLLMSNPELSALISEKIGSNWIKNLDELKSLETFVDDWEFRQRWQEIKRKRKVDFAEYILQNNGIEVDPNSIFDVQIKRIHEYKRQLLNILHVIALYNQIKDNPSIDMVPRTVIFGGKAAPGYFMAKMVIKLINSVAEIVNNDPEVNRILKVVFVANFSVSLGQFAYPAADLSEQISTAGKEASGTGNMKFSLNGALTIGTLDGANVEIREEVGAENFFLFGLTADEVVDLKQKGYKPLEYYSANPQLKRVIDQLTSGHFSPKDPGLFMPIVSSLLSSDEYMLLADFQAYMDCQNRVADAFRDQDGWTRMAILNVANMGKFSSDRTIADYCKEIWHVEPVHIELDEYSQSNAVLNVKNPPIA